MLDVNAIQGLTGAQKPPESTRGNRAGEKPPANATANPPDSVAISGKAEQAAEVQRVLSLAAEDSEVRQARVEEARQHLEQGIQTVNAVLEAVAGRLTRFI